MPCPSQPRRQPTDEWKQLCLLVASLEQAAYEFLRPVVLVIRIGSDPLGRYQYLSSSIFGRSLEPST
jgi:hypothetical protein